MQRTDTARRFNIVHPERRQPRAWACPNLGDQQHGSTQRRSHSRHDPRAGGADLLATARVDGRGCDQVRKSTGRRHARPAARRAQRRQPVFHHAQLQQAVDHGQHENCRRQVGVRRPAEEVRHHHGELRTGRARPLRLHLGENPRTQPAYRHGLDQGLRFVRTLRRFQGLRERGAGDGRRDEHHRRARWPAVRHRRADRRLRHRAAPRDRTARGAAPGEPHRAGTVRRSGDDGRRDEPVPGQVPRPPAPDPRRHAGVFRAYLQGHGGRAARRQ